MKLINVLTIASVAVMGPTLVTTIDITGSQGLDAAWAAGNGNGNGGGGKSGGRGGSKSSERGSSQAHGGGKGLASSSKRAPKGNLQSELKGLNSLKRNINGLMNSSDPKMAAFRDFVSASADLELAKEALAKVQSVYTQTSGDFLRMASDMGISSDPSTAQAELDTQMEDLLASEPEADDPAYTQWAEDAAAVTDAQSVMTRLNEDWASLQDAKSEVEGATAGTSEADMMDAIVAAINSTGAGPVTEADVTPEMAEWVAAQLGVGDSSGAIDAWLSTL
ncbi:hypothetical protein [Candidatus Halocynthiibacter alkanivorans]|uniref:hypothetical protein n=1 Tax=Candidatus Halocynthiibacter alkanivorans TaxID=2267619 RepID=UPI00109C63A7|nr:hypothetical protein [Candidatus Halocynthiibacter alkanivorans]